jgi:gluconate 2-dehydrogenase gamma chain
MLSGKGDDTPKNAEGGNMSKQDKPDDTRRAFLVGAAAAAAGAGLASEARAQDHTPPDTPPNTPPMAPHMSPHMAPPAATQPMGPSEGHGAFFNDDDAATMAAFTERLWPAAPGKPGATETGVLNYIDLALAGAYADQQDFYRRGIAQLDAYSKATHGKPFADLAAATQDDVIRALEQGKASGFTWPSAQAFFNTVRTHTMEGMFADPVYGGNKDFAGWRQVSFPGAQPLFTAADMQSREAFTRAPIVGLQSRAAQAQARKG